MSNYSDKVGLKTDHFMHRLFLKQGCINMAPEFALFTFIVMGFVIFSIDLERDEKERKRAERSYAVLTRSQTALGTLGHVPWVYSVSAQFPGLIWQNDEFTALARDMVEERRKVGCPYFAILTSFC
jgi:cytochrome P450